MTSQKTFLVKHLYLNHLKRFRIAGILYLFFLLISVTYPAYVAVSTARWDDQVLWNTGSDLAHLFDLRIEAVSVAVFALAMVILVFSYLFTARSANMMHAFPANRRSLYLSGVFAALTLMWVPQLITAAVTLLPIAVSHTGMFWLAAWWFAAEALMSIFFVGLAAFCVMFAGRAASGALFYLILNLIYAGCRFIANMLGESFVFGYNNAFDLSPGFLTPAYYLSRSGINSVWYVYPTEVPRTVAELLRVFHPEGVVRLPIFAGVGIVFLLLAFAVYRKRPVETAGSFIAIHCMKPVFKFGAACGISLAVACLATGIEEDAGMIRGTDLRFAAVLLQALVVGLIVYFIAEMMIRRSVKVFTKKQWLLWVLYSVCMVVLLCLVRFGAFGVEGRVPRAESVMRAQISTMGGSCTLKDPEELAAIHRMILDDREELRSFSDVRENDYFEEMTYVYISYDLENGTSVRRCYPLSRNDAAGNRILEEIRETLNRQENAERFFLGERIDDFRVEGVEIEEFQPYVETDEDGDTYGWYESVYSGLRLSEADRADLLEAVRADIAEGHFQITDQPDRGRTYANTLLLELAERDLGNGLHDADNTDMRELTLNADCVHTLEVLERSAGFHLSDLLTQEQYDAGPQPGTAGNSMDPAA